MSYGVLAANLPAATVTALGSYAQGITASEVYVQDRRPTVPADTAYAWWRLDDDDEVQALGQIVTRLEFDLRLVYQDGTRGNLETWRAAIRQAFHGARLPAISGLIAVEVGSVTSEDDEELEGDVEIVVPVSFVIDLLPPLLPPEDAAAADGSDGSASLSWTAPQLVDDLVTFVVRRAAGSTPPASYDAGDGVTLASALATSVTDYPGAGEFSYAVFAGYDTTGDGSADTYSVADTETVTVTVTPPATLFGNDRYFELESELEVTASGSNVTNWVDPVNSLDFANNSGSSTRPVVASAVVNGKDAIRFDGSNDVLWEADLPAALAAAATQAGGATDLAILAFVTPRATGGSGPLLQGINGGGYWDVSRDPFTPNRLSITHGDSTTAGGTAIQQFTPGTPIMVYAYFGADGSYVLEMDNDAGSGLSGSGNAPLSAISGILIGAGDTTFSDPPTPIYNAAWDVFHAVAINRAATVGERNSYRAWLNDTYAQSFPAQ